MLKIYLKQLVAYFSGLLVNKSFFDTKQEINDAVVIESEPLARFIYQSNQFNNERIKHQAFIPYFNKELNRYETSIFRIVNLSEEDTFLLANKYGRKDKTVKAIALNKVQDVINCKLELNLDNTSERHANIIGWSIDDKFERIDKARRLANEAKVRLIE